jgi:hypothetical protein
MRVEDAHGSNNEKHFDEQDSNTRIWISLTAWVDERGLQRTRKRRNGLSGIQFEMIGLLKLIFGRLNEL